ncbi:helix-turn-helix domain-containing protein [Opitutus sp. GAS368]|jgi:AraC-like DNA-binding protein|uniref:helix-turn-helix transcriptional regulator n=1 Tax=Opitutus sp. GAS368 TaxID=1882749 RepID=UPI00087A966B|nr:helix-turn-helix domain-containing protein [Opitutus sp. GAS368]SDR99707.1 Helix-turn-helix domain-containing protein [Opitutus sp. GAS368]
MISFTSSLKGGGHTPNAFFVDVLCRQIRAIENNNLRYHIPRPRHLYEQHARMPYHFKPEMFIQLGGVTEFSFPDQHITLQPGEVCIVPKGMPHGEVVRADREPFENVVVSYYNNTVDIHVAHEVSPGYPRADDVHFFTTSLFHDLISYLDRICEFHDSDPAVNALAIKGLFLAEISLLRTLVESPDSHRPATTDPVALCQWLILHNLQVEALSLESLAAEIGCSPNHLSKIFHRTTGERLVEHINRLRIRSAIDALGRTRLSIKAISASCGFSDANYFARVFRQATGRPPQQYRADVQRLDSAVEQPVKSKAGDDETGFEFGTAAEPLPLHARA